jgi:hypothetical protein
MSAGRGTPTRRSCVALLATTAVVAGLAVPAGAAKPKVSCSVAGQWETRGKGWTAIKMPEFPASDSMPLGWESYARARFAVHPSDPGLLYLTNGTRVLRSTDGGCNWASIFVIGESGSTPPTKSHFVRDITVAATPESRDTIYLLLTGYRSGVSVEHVPTYRVVKSTDAGKTWNSAEAGLPLAGTSPRLHVAPSDPDRLYLTSNVYTFATVVGQLWVSKDGGASWAPGQDLTFEPQRRRFLDGQWEIHISIDPLNSDDIWRYDFWDGLYRSQDAGATWQQIGGLDPGPSSTPTDFQANGVREVDLYHQSGEPLQVSVTTYQPCAVNSSSECSMFRSVDGGASWYKLPLPSYPNALSFAGASDKLVMMSDAAYRFDKRSAARGAIPWVGIGPSGTHGYLNEAFAAGVPANTLYAPESGYSDGSAARYIFRYTGRL